MASTKEFHDYLLFDVFQDIDGITSKRMFGGFGFYQNGTIFGLIIEDKLYFKVGDSNKKDYEKYKSKQFSYPVKGRKHLVALPYWEVPIDILEDREEIRGWIEKAVSVAK